MNSKKLHWQSRADFFVFYLYFYIYVVRCTFVSKNSWNLSRCAIILLLWSQFIAISHSDCKIINSPLSVFAKLPRVLSSAKLWTDAFEIKKKKIIKTNIKQNRSKNRALGYTRYDCIKLALFIIYLNTLFPIF